MRECFERPRGRGRRAAGRRRRRRVEVLRARDAAQRDAVARPAAIADRASGRQLVRRPAPAGGRSSTRWPAWSTAGAGGALRLVVSRAAFGGLGCSTGRLLDPGSRSSATRSSARRRRGARAIVLVRLGAAGAGRRVEAVRADRGPTSPRCAAGRRPSRWSGGPPSVYLPGPSTAADRRAADRSSTAAREPGDGRRRVAFNQVGEQVEADLQRAELIAAPILLLLSLLVFRSLSPRCCRSRSGRRPCC